jgi:cellulose synthase operon protein YhjQ
MTDRKALQDPNEPPEDVASLYSWANLHGAKYRDFSASRALTRERARQRAQQTLEEAQERARQEADARHAAEEQAHLNELAVSQAAAEAARQAAHLAAQQVAHLAAQQAAQEMARQAAQHVPPQGQNAPPPQAAQRSAWRPPELPGRWAFQPDFSQPEPALVASQPFRPAPPMAAPMREDLQAPLGRTAWNPPEVREAPVRPAWLAERSEPAAPAGLPQTPGDTIQGSRERLTSRWFALKGLFNRSAPVADAAPAAAPASAHAPVLAVFSLAGGVGKTSLVATLGRALSARGERVLLVDTAAFGLLPFFFGARDQRPGQLRTFSPPAASGDAPIQMIAVDPDALGAENAPQEALTAEIEKCSRGVGRILIDLATASGATTRRVLKLSPLVLVPVVPDMTSVVSVSAIEEFFERNSGALGHKLLPYYLLNQFDASLPLHLDVREVLREQLGDRLLSFALRRAPAVSEALAEGMTVMDYAPNSTVAEDFGYLAGWVKSQSAPALGSFRGVRWSER